MKEVNGGIRLLGLHIYRTCSYGHMNHTSHQGCMPRLGVMFTSVEGINSIKYRHGDHHQDALIILISVQQTRQYERNVHEMSALVKISRFVPLE